MNDRPARTSTRRANIKHSCSQEEICRLMRQVHDRLRRDGLTTSWSGAHVVTFTLQLAKASIDGRVDSSTAGIIELEVTGPSLTMMVFGPGATKKVDRYVRDVLGDSYLGLTVLNR